MISGHKTLSKEVILAVVSEEDLFRYYCPAFAGLDIPFCSELRKDTNASCRVSDWGGFLLYKDFGSGLPGTNIWGYVTRKYGIVYSAALDKIAVDFKIVAGISYDCDTQLDYTTSKIYSKDTTISIKKREWALADKAYWNERYGITLSVLQEYKVSAISDFWVNKTWIHPTDPTYCYDYYYHNGRLLRKIYRPYSLYKWVSNIDNTVVQGIDNIPKTNDLLIITKSMKDIMCLRILGYYSVAPNNEVGWIPDSVWTKFISRYKRLVLFFDNDTAGITNAQQFSNKYGIQYIYIPTELQAKDISDYIDQTRSLDKASNLLTNLLQ